jgi:hypothetical protein|tara:strand:- start:112 stop:552 length:441 start_codon:yes stop_codon:yes gene_type:complete
MSKSFSELAPSTREVILDRFNRYGIDGEYMYNDTDFFSDEMKNFSEQNFLEMFDFKHISHIMPKSQYPWLSNEPTNVFLEDISENLSRGASIVTPNELNMAYYDQIQDTQDFDINDDGIIDLTNLENNFGSTFDYDSWDFDFFDYL